MNKRNLGSWQSRQDPPFCEYYNTIMLITANVELQEWHFAKILKNLSKKGASKIAHPFLLKYLE